MSDLTERLVPNGVYVPSSPVDPEPDRARSSRLHINSFSNIEQRFMKLQPLADPDAEPRALPERILPVTVISSDGRKRPMMFGMPVKQVRIVPQSAVVRMTCSVSLSCWEPSGDLAPEAGLQVVFALSHSENS